MIKEEYAKKSFIYELLLNLDIPFISKVVLNKIYDKEFFFEGEKFKKDSAAKVAEIINSCIRFSSVFDIGCGMGIYLEEMHRLGKEAFGCDYSVEGLRISPKEFTVFQADATKPITLNRKFDLLICFEVAEHIQKKYSRQLVTNCTQNSDTVLFTAAPVGQGGVGHINEQPYEFWIEKFGEQGFTLDKELSEAMRIQMKKENVVFWIANNVMLFRCANRSNQTER
jgi:SAM-dependent methyltransferase